MYGAKSLNKGQFFDRWSIGGKHGVKVLPPGGIYDISTFSSATGDHFSNVSDFLHLWTICQKIFP